VFTKRSVKLKLIQCVTFLSALLGFNSFAQACSNPLLLSFNGDWPPYFVKLGEGRFGGSDYTLFQQAMSSTDCAFDVVEMSKGRADKEIMKGTIDVFAGASFTQNRNRDFYFSIPYRKEAVSYVVAVSNLDMPTDSLESILQKGKRVAINTSGYFGERVATLMKRYPNQFIHSFSLPDRITYLMNGKVSAVIDDRTALCAAMTQRLLSSNNRQYTVSTDILHEDQIHYMFNRKSTSSEFIASFNQALNTRLENNVLDFTGQCKVMQNTSEDLTHTF
jgi:hypothetical protein